MKTLKCGWQRHEKGNVCRRANTQGPGILCKVRQKRKNKISYVHVYNKMYLTSASQVRVNISSLLINGLEDKGYIRNYYERST